MSDRRRKKKYPRNALRESRKKQIERQESADLRRRSGEADRGKIYVQEDRSKETATLPLGSRWEQKC